MRAGALDRRITLLRATVTQDAYNADVPVWGVLAKVRASKRDVGDAERQRAAQVGASITARFQIRWSSQVARLSAADQLDCEGVRYAISAVKELGRREGLEITAAALANGATPPHPADAG